MIGKIKMRGDIKWRSRGKGKRKRRGDVVDKNKSGYNCVLAIRRAITG